MDFVIVLLFYPRLKCLIDIDIVRLFLNKSVGPRTESQIENLWPTVLKFVKIHEFYHYFLKFVKIRKSSFLNVLMNAAMNLDFASVKFAFCFSTSELTVTYVPGQSWLF